MLSALLLICVNLTEIDADGPAHDPGDVTHINVRPMSWWENEASAAGWSFGDASAINTDERSRKMAWAGRFLYLIKEESRGISSGNHPGVGEHHQ